MLPDEPIKTVSGVVSVVGDLIKAAGDHPSAKEAAKNLGKAAVTVSRTINTVLLPLAAINFAVDKAKVYFNEKFAQDLGLRVCEIPAEHLVEPKASIAGPALQGLAFVHEEPGLRDLYLGLIATAMDGRKAREAHPAFVEIIKQLDAFEAVQLMAVMSERGAIPIVQLRRKRPAGGGYHIVKNNVIASFENDEPVEVPGIEVMIDNWCRLGLFTVDYTTYFNAETHYTWVEARPEFIRFSEGPAVEGYTLHYERGVLKPTAFGLQFAAAVEETQPQASKSPSTPSADATE